MYEVFDHTADVGVRARAASLELLLSEAARGMFSLIVANLDEVRPVDEETLVIEGADPAYLMFDWLSELLYAFATRRRLVASYEVQLTRTGLTARVWGEAADERRHRLEHEVKAVTYHGLRCERTEEGWVAEFILDI
ncbi:MAG: archease [Pirellulales bacterium]